MHHHGLVGTPQPVEQAPHQLECPSITRKQSGGPLQRIERSGKFSLRLQRLPQVIMPLGIVRGEPESLPERIRRLGRAAAAQQRDAEMKMGSGKRRPLPNGVPKIAFGFGGLADPGQQLSPFDQDRHGVCRGRDGGAQLGKGPLRISSLLEEVREEDSGLRIERVFRLGAAEKEHRVEAAAEGGEGPGLAQGTRCLRLVLGSGIPKHWARDVGPEWSQPGNLIGHRPDRVSLELGTVESFGSDRIGIRSAVVPEAAHAGS